MNMLFKDKLVTVLRGFANNEQGAVAIDWVILTAGIVVVSIAAMSLFRFDDTGGHAITPQCEKGGGKIIGVTGTGGPIMFQMVGKIKAILGATQSNLTPEMPVALTHLRFFLDAAGPGGSRSRYTPNLYLGCMDGRDKRNFCNRILNFVLFKK